MDVVTREPILADWQKSGEPSNLSNDVLRLVNQSELALQSKEIGGTLVELGLQTPEQTCTFVADQDKSRFRRIGKTFRDVVQRQTLESKRPNRPGA